MRRNLFIRLTLWGVMPSDVRTQRISQWASGNPQPPVRMEIHPTDRCNLKCRFCWQVEMPGDFDFSRELPDDKWKSLVHEAGQMGVKEWIVSGGGEPFMRPALTLELMRIIKSYGMWGQLTTNGTMVQEQAVKDIVEMGWDQVQISLDGPDAGSQDYLRAQKSVFSRAVRTAQRLTDHKRLLGSERPYVGFNTIITRRNYTRLAEHIQLAHDVGFQLVYFEPLYAGYVQQERLHLDTAETEEMQPYIEEAKKLADNLGVSTNVERFRLRKDFLDKGKLSNTILREAGSHPDPWLSLPCYQPWFLMAVKGSGLAGCCSSFEIGEHIHEKTLSEVWYGETFNRLRTGMLKKNLPYYCDKCSIYVVMDNKEIREKMHQVNVPAPPTKGILSWPLLRRG